MHYVYILYCASHDKYYKGFTSNLERRLWEHNQGLSRYTSQYGPWTLVYSEKFEDKTSALKREKALKKYDHWQIRSLLNSMKREN